MPALVLEDLVLETLVLPPSNFLLTDVDRIFDLHNPFVVVGRSGRAMIDDGLGAHIMIVGDQATCLPNLASF